MKAYVRLIGVLLLSALLQAGCGVQEKPRAAEIVQDGKVLRRIEPGKVSEKEIMTVTYGTHENQIEIGPEGIRMLSSDCPDQICVRTGKLREDGLPIVCLPHRLVIQWTE